MFESICQQLASFSLVSQLLFGLLLLLLFKLSKLKTSLAGGVPAAQGAIPIFGNLFQLLGNPLVRDDTPIHKRFVRILTKESLDYSERGISVLWLFYKANFLIYKPELVEKVLLNTEEITKGSSYKFLYKWLRDGLLVTTGRKHKLRRKLLTPAFHFSILNDFIPTFSAVASRLSERLRQQRDNQFRIANLYDPLARATLEAICETSLGIRLEQIERGDSTRQALNYAEAIRIASKVVFTRAANPILEFDSIFELTADGRQFAKTARHLASFMDSVIEARIEQRVRQRESGENANSQESANYRESANQARSSNQPKSSNQLKPTNQPKAGQSESIYFGRSKQRKAFLDLLVDTYLDQQHDAAIPACDRLDLLGIREEVNTFTFAGGDTSSVTLFATLYFLGLNPECQQRCYEEIVSELGWDNSDSTTSIPTSEQLSQLKYLEACIKETLRLVPPVPIILRTTQKEMRLQDTQLNKEYRVPADTCVAILIQQLHLNPIYFEDPHAFKPERFLQSDKQTAYDMRYIPFSAGLRNCIGQRFALLNLKVTIATLLRDFRFESLLPLDQLSMATEIVQKPDIDVPCAIYPRI